MLVSVAAILLSLLPSTVVATPIAGQTVLSPQFPQPAAHIVDQAILNAASAYDDPVAGLLSIRPELADVLSEPRLLRLLEGEQDVWASEGDKLRLRKQGKKFMDVTDHQHLLGDLKVSPPNLPKLAHQRWVKPCFDDISTQEMHDNLAHLTSYYNRYYYSINGEKSARWIHDYLSKIISESPVQTYISLEYHTNKFPQPSIIARFEPPHRNASLPLTIIGAHQDSANYLFPLLPAPGADDDCSGSVTIMEAFRVLANRGFIPELGPVEFHWYAAEEAGLYGSLDIAAYKKDQGAKVGAMMEFDMTAFIHKNATESIYFVSTQADKDLTNWCADLAREYSSLEVGVEELGPLAGSDYMAWTKAGYPAAFATEGNPLARGGFPGDFDPYVHSDKDRMDVNDDQGVFSIDHMAKFTEIAIAFVVEQAGWSSKHTRAGDGEGSESVRFD